MKRTTTTTNEAATPATPATGATAPARPREAGKPQRGEPADPRLFEPPDGLCRQPEGSRRTGLHLTEDVEPAEPQHNVKLAVAARPVAGDHFVTAGLVPGHRHVLARPAKGRSC